VSAVLERRFDLDLSLEQVEKLERIDARLAEQNAALREAPQPPEEMPGGRARGVDVPRGRFGRGMGRGPPSAARGHDSARADENDTAAYLEAEQVLTETQRPAARDIATRYREERFDLRQGIRRQRVPPAATPTGNAPQPVQPAPDIPAGSML
jgi:hypothetical protein